jgi:cyclopropane fatty-acyl-phospholipid synthase-like methyltransferase
MNVKQYAPATQRNRQPILEVLQRFLPQQGNILEIASGTGEHAVFFAASFPHCQWYTSDRDAGSRASIRAWSEEYSLNNLHPPLELDASSQQWSIETTDTSIDAIVNINMIHISPYSACEGLMAGAGRILPRDGILYLYGPYQRQGKHTSLSNEAFDRSLRDRDPQWGVRNLEDVIIVAEKANLILKEVISMPANNLSVIFMKSTN